MILTKSNLTNEDARAAQEVLRALSDSIVEVLTADAVRLEPGDEEWLTRGLVFVRDTLAQVHAHEGRLEGLSKQERGKSLNRQQMIMSRGRAILLSRRGGSDKVRGR